MWIMNNVSHYRWQFLHLSACYAVYTQCAMRTGQYVGDRVRRTKSAWHVGRTKILLATCQADRLSWTLAATSVSPLTIRSCASVKSSSQILDLRLCSWLLHWLERWCSELLPLCRKHNIISIVKNREPCVTDWNSTFVAHVLRNEVNSGTK